MGKVKEKKNKNTYRSFDEFRQEFLAALEEVGRRKSFKKALAQLRRNVKYDVTNDHINETLEVINQNSDKNLFRLAIVCEAELGRSGSTLLHKLAADIIGKARKDLGYPFHIGTEAVKEGGSTRIIGWTDEINRPLPGEERGVLEAEVVRTALICLLPDKNKPFFVPAILRILRQSIKPPRVKKQRAVSLEEPNHILARTATQHIIQRRPKTAAIKAFVETTTSLIKDIEKYSAQLDRMADDLRGARADLADSDSRFLELKEVCREKEEHISQIFGDLKESNARISEEQERYHALEKHWKELSLKQRNEAVFKVKSYLDHEVNEIQLCLDRDQPNIEMAMERVNKITLFLASLKSI